MALLMFAGGCGSDQLTGPEDFATARMRWMQNGPSSYTITVNYSCYCPLDIPGPVDVTVRSGIVTSRRFVGLGTEVPASYADVFPSVDELFDEVQQALREHIRPHELKFDRTLGFPTRVAIGDPALDAPVTTTSNLRAAN